VTGVWVVDLAWNIGSCLLRGRPAADFGVGVTGGLTLGGSVCLRDLALFATRAGFGYGGSFGAACGFDAFGGCGAGGFFGFTQSPAHGGVRVFSLMSAGGVGCVTRGGLSGNGSSFGLGLSEERLFADLLCGAVSQLRTIFAARSGEVAIFCSVKIGPGVKNCHIFRCFCY
jgi:hypothetical protein